MSDRRWIEVGVEPLQEARVHEFLGTAESGGVVVFSGLVRNHHQGRGVTRIDYSCVDTLALAKLDELTAEIEAVLGEGSVDHWVEVINAAHVPCGPVLDLEQVSTDPQVLAW